VAHVEQAYASFLVVP